MRIISLSRAESSRTKPDRHDRPIPGQHIRVNRGTYTHHGIYVGSNRVIELAKPRQGGQTRVVSLPNFLQGGVLEMVTHLDGLPPSQVLRNALHAPNRPYDLLGWNCEHFATWCSTGKAQSPQAEAFKSLALVGLVAVVAMALLDRQAA